MLSTVGTTTTMHNFIKWRHEQLDGEYYLQKKVIIALQVQVVLSICN